MTDKSELNERGIEAAEIAFTSRLIGYDPEEIHEAIPYMLAAYLAIAPQAPDHLATLRWAHDTLIELNINNYTHDDVCEANAAAVEVILGIAPLLSEKHGKTDEWWAARGVTPQAPVSAVVEALKDIASQKTYAEMPDDVRDDLDFVGGYEMCVNLARSALASPPPPAQADDELVFPTLERRVIGKITQADDGKDAEIERLTREAAMATAAKTGLLQALQHHTGFDHGVMAIRTLVERAEKAEALIRELVAALDEASEIIDVDYPRTVERLFMPIITRAKAAGYEPC